MPVGAQTRCQISKLETNFQVDRPESTVVHYLMGKNEIERKRSRLQRDRKESVREELGQTN